MNAGDLILTKKFSLSLSKFNKILFLAVKAELVRKVVFYGKVMSLTGPESPIFLKDFVIFKLNNRNLREFRPSGANDGDVLENFGGGRSPKYSSTESNLR